MSKIYGLQTVKVDDLITPSELMHRHPVSVRVSQHVILSRRRIEKILLGKDKRLLVIIGPCSIHDLEATMEYAHRLFILRKKYRFLLEIVMRTYFVKPRTVMGWKGFIFDPDLNGRCRVNYGIELARKLLLQVNELGIPTATEFLDIITWKFISDLISWGSIGARTAESQIHREIASSLAFPIGFKNSTSGNTHIAINAIRAARASHVFLSPDKNGKITIYQSKGNPYSHIIMRGGEKPNYSSNDITAVCNILHQFDLPEYFIIDFSHGNCQKKYRRQLDVCHEICRQIRNGSTAIAGIMVESFLIGGKQTITSGKSLVYGQSITDPCLGWEESEYLLAKLASAVESRL